MAGFMLPPIPESWAVYQGGQQNATPSAPFEAKARLCKRHDFLEDRRMSGTNIQMKWIASIVLTVAGFGFNQCDALAWAGAGHQVIAAEAYRELSPELKAQAIGILKAHPDYAKWAAAYHPNPQFDQFAYAFMRSSTWPDEIRRSGSQYDHPNWHFIDYPLKPPSFSLEPGPKPDDDILYGISQCERTLSDTNANPELRAVYLSYLVHLVGDIHQPLHCASLFTDAYPKGDRGGNDFFVRPAQRVVRLHGIWDGLLGTAANPQVQWRYAIEIEGEYPKTVLPELASHPTPKDWSLESRALAIQRGYLRGELKGGTNADSAPSLPDGYTKTAQTVAERQAALAGYRLADEIEKCLKSSGAVPLLPEAGDNFGISRSDRGGRKQISEG